MFYCKTHNSNSDDRTSAEIFIFVVLNSIVNEFKKYQQILAARFYYLEEFEWELELYFVKKFLRKCY